MFKKAKTNPGLGITETEVKKLIINKMLENVTVNNYNPSRRSMGRCLTEAKVASALDGGFSITDKVTNKTMVRHTSENSIIL